MDGKQNPHMLLASNKYAKLNYFMTIASAWGARLASSITQLIGVRWMMSDLGADRYSVLAVMLAVQGWMLLSDLGIGAALQNALSRSRARAMGEDAIISSTAIILLFVAIAGLTVWNLVAPWLQGLILKSYQAYAPHDGGLSLRLIGTALIVMVISTSGSRILYARQYGWIIHISTIVSSVIGFIAFNYLHHMHSQAIMAWGCATTFPLAFVNSILLICVVLPSLRRARPKKSELIPIIHDARRFAEFAFLAAAILHVDIFIIARNLPPRQLVTYVLLQRIFDLAFSAYNAIHAASWPILSEQLALKQINAANHALMRIMFAGLAIILGTSLFVIPFREFVLMIVAPGQQIQLPVSTILWFSAYFLLRVWCDTFALGLQSASDLTILRRSSLAQAFISPMLVFWGAHTGGANGACAGLLASFVLTSAWTSPLGYRNLSKHCAI